MLNSKPKSIKNNNTQSIPDPKDNTSVDSMYSANPNDKEEYKCVPLIDNLNLSNNHYYDLVNSN